MKNASKYLLLAAKILVGGLFIFSGFIKLNDPWGTAYKLEEYFEVFAEHSSFFLNFVPFSLYLSVLMCSLEIILGVALLINYRIKITVWLLIGIIVFFTFLTFYSAYFNKVTHCGCFGDFLKLKPWTSFWKDIVLTVLTLFIYFKKNELPDLLSLKIGDTIVGATTVACLVFAYYVLAHLSLFDFSFYKVGNHLPTLKKPTELKIDYIYLMKDKSGKITESTTYDEKLEFVSMKYGYTIDGERFVKDSLDPELTAAKISDFDVMNPDDNTSVLEEVFKGKKLLIILPFFEKANLDHIKEINALAKQAEQNGITPMLLTATDKATVNHYRHDLQLAVPYYFCDGTVLKTVVRANPGLIFLQDGYVRGKWHHNDVPSLEVLKKALK